MITEAGHYPWLERPEMVRPLLRDFLLAGSRRVACLTDCDQPLNVWKYEEAPPKAVDHAHQNRRTRNSN